MIDKDKLNAQRDDVWYNMLLSRKIGENRKIGEVKYVCSCDEKQSNEFIVSTCPICCGRLKHNFSGKTGIVCRCRLCDAEFIIKVNFKGDLWKGEKQ